MPGASHAKRDKLKFYPPPSSFQTLIYRRTLVFKNPDACSTMFQRWKIIDNPSKLIICCVQNCINVKVEISTKALSWKYVATSTFIWSWNVAKHQMLENVLHFNVEMRSNWGLTICCGFDIVSTLRKRWCFNVSTFSPPRWYHVAKWFINLLIFDRPSTSKQRCIYAAWTHRRKLRPKCTIHKRTPNRGLGRWCWGVHAHKPCFKG